MLKRLHKASLAAIILSAILALSAVFAVAEANFFVGPYITIQSPSSRLVYTNTTLPLELVASVRYDRPEILGFFYSLDGASNVTLTDLTRTDAIRGFDFRAAAALENLAQGNHTLSAYSQDANGEIMFTYVEFTVDPSYSSPFLVLFPKNTTYLTTGGNTTDIALTFSCSENILWANYHLAIVGQGTALREDSIAGNLTLSVLPVGDYKLTLSGWTQTGPINQTIYFTIAKPQHFPTDLVLAVFIGIILVVTVFLLFHIANNPRRRL
jgi:hypothetical protein